MRIGTIALLAVMSGLWICGLLDQLYSTHATMRYLALSLGFVAIAVWRWQPQRRLQKQRSRDRTPPR
jgi:hypothetical protein